jgi:hypothetical protein
MLYNDELYLETNYNYDIDAEVFEDIVGEPVPD